MAAPLCLFWTVWQVRNRAAFEDVAPFAHRMKVTFFMYLVVLGKFVYDFLAWLGYR